MARIVVTVPDDNAVLTLIGYLFQGGYRSIAADGPAVGAAMVPALAPPTVEQTAPAPLKRKRRRRDGVRLEDKICRLYWGSGAIVDEVIYAMGDSQGYQRQSVSAALSRLRSHNFAVDGVTAGGASCHAITALPPDGYDFDRKKPVAAPAQQTLV